jgi:hypothetical protein
MPAQALSSGSVQLVRHAMETDWAIDILPPVDFRLRSLPLRGCLTLFRPAGVRAWWQCAWNIGAVGLIW